MPLGLIWSQQLTRGARIEDIAARWPDMTVEEIARIVDVASRRYHAATNQRK
jgi:uncharacterized protein (DUF433 family)